MRSWGTATVPPSSLRKTTCLKTKPHWPRQTFWDMSISIEPCSNLPFDWLMGCLRVVLSHVADVQTHFQVGIALDSLGFGGVVLQRPPADTSSKGEGKGKEGCAQVCSQTSKGVSGAFAGEQARSPLVLAECDGPQSSMLYRL